MPEATGANVCFGSLFVCLLYKAIWHCRIEGLPAAMVVRFGLSIRDAGSTTTWKEATYLMSRSGKVKIYDHPERKAIPPLLLILLIVLLLLAWLAYKILRH